MKKIIFLFLTILLVSCSDSDGVLIPTTATIVFNHNWNGKPVSKSDIDNTTFTNANNTDLKITRFRYVLSRIQFKNAEGAIFSVRNYELVDISEDINSLEIDIPSGTYTMSFIFGFTDKDNEDGIYPDLNSANFNVPGMLGGGYHYMQFDGKYINNQNIEAPFNYHAIRAADISDAENPIYKDTSFEIKASNISVRQNPTISINVNLAEWFINPNNWDLNQLNQRLMPNYDAQLLMSENGKTVFSISK